MSTTDLSSATWRKSTRSNGEASCVEVTDLDSGHYAVRDSKSPTGPALLITPTQWAAFTTALRAGELA
ncbi:MAG TPA: DUF397 domain-containing protein [Pseudonocardiaceae bacterium]|nr:DUF397 domain-containing protein [Pseudonocardiaceae bacterium]